MNCPLLENNLPLTGTQNQMPQPVYSRLQHRLKYTVRGSRHRKKPLLSLSRGTNPRVPGTNEISTAEDYPQKELKSLSAKSGEARLFSQALAFIISASDAGIKSTDCLLQSNKEKRGGGYKSYH